MRRRSFAFASVAALTFSRARAQAFPSRPIRLVVAFPAGGGADILARAIGQKMAVALGQPVIVENRVGASGLIGSDFVAKSAPDGYTLLMVSTTQAIASKLYPRAPFDLSRNFSPVAFVGTTPLALVVNPGFPAKSLPELIEIAKTRRTSYASAATGTVGHLSMELLKSAAHFDMLHVPYSGTAPATNDLIGGQVDAMMDILPNAVPYVKSGRVRILAVTSSARVPDLPDVPTVAESVPGFEAQNWYGILAPAGMNESLVSALNTAATTALGDAEVVSRLGAQGYTVIRMSPAGFADFIEQDLRKWQQAIKDSGAKVE